ncbi:hypothetical protein B0O80DRAFT_427173 [Mortierella sp. GBAus27b]|nr:hypothetical protein BGX31_007343 [Mortierella sp. GBA43]KAI8353166.1 hypothetical protein B0O80DRAFT_427173 [Mortierella sp. GBAus27b]
MLQSPTIPTPAPVAPAPAAPRTPRQSRKSAISVALQNQSQSQGQSQGQGNTNRQQRNPAQIHARHQSMPSQPRSNSGSPPAGSSTNDHSSKSTSSNSSNNNNNTSKRSSAPLVPPTATVPIQILKNQQGSTQGAPKQSNNDNQQRNPRTHGQKRSPSNQQESQSNDSGSKGKRNQRRKDVECNVDLAKVEVEATALNQSPPLNPSSPPSTDSDDSESAVHRPDPPSRPTKTANKSNGRSGKGGQPSAGPQRPNSAPGAPQPRKGSLAMQQRQQNTGSGHNQQQLRQSGRPASESMADLPSDSADTQPRPIVSKASSADKVTLAHRVVTEPKSILYAGPTFHNSPAPASLPIPAFATPLFSGTSGTELPFENQPFFGDGASPHLNSMRPQRTQSETTGWTAHHSLPGMSSTTGISYHIPDRIATSSYVADGPATHGTDQLMEISQSLRNLLKIQSQ